MKFLPRENYTIQTALSPEEVLARIDAMANDSSDVYDYHQNAKRGKYTFKYRSKDYVLLLRNITYKNSFRPEIKIRIQEGSVKVSMSMKSGVVIFFCIWSSIVFLAMLAFALQCIQERSLIPAVFVPIVMLIFGYAITKVGFNMEASAAKKDIADAMKE